MTRTEKIAAAKQHVAQKMGDIIEKNFDNPGGALETAGTFTALLEAYQAAEIAEAFEKKVGSKGKGYNVRSAG